MMAQFIDISSKYDKSIPEIHDQAFLSFSVQDTIQRNCSSD